jgi:hypothetical protein
MPDELEAIFWLPNHPETHGRIVECCSGAGRVGDEFYEVVQVSPEYPGGTGAAAMRVRLVFRRVPPTDYVISLDELFEGAFCPWPGKAEDRVGR